MVSATAEAAAPAAPAKAGRRYLYEVDIIRILTFIGVIAQHVILRTAAGSSVRANGVTHLVHFTREAFFTLTAFVLVYSMRGKKRSVGRFYVRRFGLVLAPYIIWNAAYAYAEYQNRSQSVHQLLASFWGNLETGYYHLYFMFVIFQIYLLFPLMLWLLRVTEGHHAKLFVASAAFEFALMAYLHYHGQPSGFAGTLYNWCQHNRFFLTYQFYIVAGALAAAHYDAFDAWVRRNRTNIVVGGLIAAALAEYQFLLNVDIGQSPGHASAVFQPVMVIWDIAAVLAMYAIGSWWAERRRPGRLASGIQWGSDISFGVYLCHIMIIFYLLPVFDMTNGPHRRFPQPLDGILSLLLTAVIAAAFSTVAMRTPLSRVLVGRAQSGSLLHRRRSRHRHASGRPRRPEQTSASTEKVGDTS